MFIPLHLGLLCPSPHERGNGSLGFWFLAIPVLCALAGSSVLFPLQGLVTLSYLPRAISTSRHLIDEEEMEFYANLQPELKTPVLMQPQKKAVCYLLSLHTVTQVFEFARCHFSRELRILPICFLINLWSKRGPVPAFVDACLSSPCSNHSCQQTCSVPAASLSQGSSESASLWCRIGKQTGLSKAISSKNVAVSVSAV